LDFESCNTIAFQRASIHQIFCEKHFLKTKFTTFCILTQFFCFGGSFLALMLCFWFFWIAEDTTDIIKLEGKKNQKKKDFSS
jgi:hypothetical protein